MADYAGISYVEIQFDKNGNIFQDNGYVDFINNPVLEHLFVISHGWNNDIAEARKLYKDLFAKIAVQMGADIDKKKYGILAVLWPSKRFAEKELIPSGNAASLGVDTALTGQSTDHTLRQQIIDLQNPFDIKAPNGELDEDMKLNEFIDKLDDLKINRQTRIDFFSILQNILKSGSEGNIQKEPMELMQDQDVDDIFRTALEAPLDIDFKTGNEGGASSMWSSYSDINQDGGAAGIGNWLVGAKEAALNLLNYTTYYKMKERAGVIGGKGLGPVIKNVLRLRPDLKVHLIGHSFGARLVAAAARTLSDLPVKPKSMTLLQAAFSHNGFSNDVDGKPGFFRDVVAKKNIAGPIIISYTENDKAVGIAYPLASRIANQAYAGLGDKDDKFGGMGRNGAQKTDEAFSGNSPQVLSLDALKPSDINLDKFQIYNLNADNCIVDHGSICVDEVAKAILIIIKL